MKIKKLNYIIGFPNSFLSNGEESAYAPENKEGIIVNKLNQIIDHLNEKEK